MTAPDSSLEYVLYVALVAGETGGLLGLGRWGERRCGGCPGERQAGGQLGCVSHSPHHASHWHRGKRSSPPTWNILQAWKEHWGSSRRPESSKSHLDTGTSIGKASP